MILKGKKGIISGALDESSIAWKVAERCHDEGAEFTLTNAPMAMRMGKINELGEKCNAEVIGADLTSIEEIENLYEKSLSKMNGKIDFILHSVGMSPNVRKKKEYGDLNYDWLNKTLDVSAISFHKMLQVAEKNNVLNEWSSSVALSYVAAQRTFPFYSDMAEAKSLLESIARSYGYRLGKLNNSRVNTISQSPTITTAGSGISGFQAFFNYAEKMSPLGNATADECANYCIFLFSDMSKKITMQNLFHDGGFSSTGISEDIIEDFS
jgi:enoyl-[acyl-carrier protein] reductase I|tara:strand:+ start:82 stop:882 length:801 start_codon:yes stop_codon:yes gene_type:complete